MSGENGWWVAGCAAASMRDRRRVGDAERSPLLLLRRSVGRVAMVAGSRAYLPVSRGLHALRFQGVFRVFSGCLTGLVCQTILHY